MTGDRVNISGVAAAAHAEAAVKRAGTSFFWAMRLLPQEKRRAMYAIYAFCREVDDIADEPGAAPDKIKALQNWREEIERLYDSVPEMPVSVALMSPLAKYGLHKRDFLDVIDGMEMDARVRVRIADMAELELYCDRVACAVGRLSNRVFGIDDDRGDKIAHSLGQALQLTNILRDIYEDAMRDRVYLPADLLARHGIDVNDVQKLLKHPALADVCWELATLVGTRFDEAATALKGCDKSTMRPAIIMMQIYGRIFRRLMARGWEQLDQPVRLPKLEKIWLVIRYGFLP